MRPRIESDTLQKERHVIPLHRAAWQTVTSDWKERTLRKGEKTSVFVTALMKTCVLQCVYHEHICSPDIKLIVQGTVLKTLIGTKYIFSTAYLYEKFR
jgi:hypothetical protein